MEQKTYYYLALIFIFIGLILLMYILGFIIIPGTMEVEVGEVSVKYEGPYEALFMGIIVACFCFAIILGAIGKYKKSIKKD